MHILAGGCLPIYTAAASRAAIVARKFLSFSFVIS